MEIMQSMKMVLFLIIMNLIYIEMMLNLLTTKITHIIIILI